MYSMHPTVVLEAVSTAHSCPVGSIMLWGKVILLSGEEQKVNWGKLVYFKDGAFFSNPSKK